MKPIVTYMRVSTDRQGRSGLGMEAQRPVGWCAVAPRAEFPSLDRSPVARRVDEAEVWSINCFYIDKAWRRKRLMRRLIEAAVAHAARSGAEIVEAYPLEPADRKPRSDAFLGLAAAFGECGFVEVARRRPARPVMRRHLA